MKQQTYCSKCGGPLVPDDLFCSSCGASVKVTKPDVAPTGKKAKKQVIRRVPRFNFWVACVFLFITILPSAALIGDGYTLNSSRGYYLKILGYIQIFAYGYYFKTSIRRLHDIGYSGWFVFPSAFLSIAAPIFYIISLFCEPNNPVVGYADIVIWSAITVQFGMIAWLGFTKGVKGPNKYGPDPLRRREKVIVASDSLREKAEQEDPNAQYDLAALYMYGEGVEQDAKEAVKWYRKAAEQGLVDAQYDLGLCYMEGKGTDKNPHEAMKWLCKAAEQGHQPTIRCLRDAAEQGDKQAKETLRALGLDDE